MKMNPDLMVFFQGITFLKWWRCRCWYTLLHFLEKLKLFISIVLVLSMFLKKIKEFIRNKNIKANIFREQASNSITCWYLCIGFTGSMQVKNGLTLPVCFLLIILKTMTVYFETFQRWKKVILLTKLTG